MTGYLLTNDQKHLLARLVEAVRNTPNEKRQKFIMFHTISSGTGVHMIHPGLQREQTDVYEGDIEELARVGLISLQRNQHGYEFDVINRGFQYYEEMKMDEDGPVTTMERTIRSYVDAEGFRRRYQAAYDKWSRAERQLWSSDSEESASTIGHLCREALQEFADVLVRQKGVGTAADKAATVARIRDVLKDCNASAAEKSFLEALIMYWGTVNDLVQRQEHGGQREGNQLLWEDSRRVVFQTVMVMFEIDRAVR